MAVEISDGGSTPHATDYADLLAKLVIFATANGWTQLENTSDKVVLSGEGAGSDAIIVAFQKYANGWNINGYTGYTDGLTFFNQPGALPSGSANPCSPSMPLWDSTIPYWFIVNERRIIVVAKVSTTFQMCYAGWMLPYASPGQYPYPMFIGGSCAGQNGVYTGVTAISHAFWRGASGGVVSHAGYLSGGSKVGTTNEFYAASNLASPGFKGLHPYLTSNGIFGYVGNGIGQMTKALDDSEILVPVSWCVDEFGYQGIVGDLDGVYFPSSGGSSEDIISDGVNDYLIVQNVFRTASTDLVAIRLV